MTWRIVTKALHEMDKPATSAEIETFIGGACEAGHSLQEAAKMNLVVRPGRGSIDGGGPGLWRLTARGTGWANGSLREVRGPLPEEIQRWMANRHKKLPRPRGHNGRGIWFAATWLAALPRGLKMTPRAAQPLPDAA